MKHIVIVDDAMDLGKVLQTMLLTIDPGLSIRVTPSAEEALLDAGRRPLDLLVTDIRLPGMSGLELVRKLRARQPAIKVIIMTGVSDERIIRQANDLKAEAFLRKPLDFPRFLDAARACLELSAPVVEVAPPQPRLPELVSGLRQSLNAQAVFVLDDLGKVAAQAGTLPKVNLEKDWAPALFAVLSASQRAASLADLAGGPTVQVFEGKAFTLVLAPVGVFALLVVLKHGDSALRLALAVQESLAAQIELAKALAPAPAPAVETPVPAAPPAAEKPVTPPPPPVPALEPIDEAAAGELEKKLAKAKSKIKPEDIDAFWETLPEETPAANGGADVLSYDQAARLGFTPDKEEGKK